MFERQNEKILNPALEIGEEIKLPTIYGNFKMIPFLETAYGKEHIALIKGNLQKEKTVLVRVHSACATGDLFGSMRCDCGEQLKQSMKLIEKEECGILIYLQQEGRGIGLMDKAKAYKLQEDGLDTVDANLKLGHQADERDYNVGAQILQSLGVSNINLLTNNPGKKKGLIENGINVEKCIPILTQPNSYNSFYLRTKQERMGHLLPQLSFNEDE